MGAICLIHVTSISRVPTGSTRPAMYIPLLPAGIRSCVTLPSYCICHRADRPVTGRTLVCTGCRQSDHYADPSGLRGTHAFGGHHACEQRVGTRDLPHFGHRNADARGWRIRTFRGRRGPVRGKVGQGNVPLCAAPGRTAAGPDAKHPNPASQTAGVDRGRIPLHICSSRRFRRKARAAAWRTLADSQDLSINLTIIPGVTLPVIVRHGALSATAVLSEFSLARRRREKQPAAFIQDQPKRRQSRFMAT